MKQFLCIFSLCFLLGCSKYVTRDASSNTGSGTGGSGTGNGSSGSGSSGSTGGSSGGSGSTLPININFTSSSPCAPSNEVFTFTCTGAQVPSNATFEWYFGDGNTGKNATATNAYVYAGNYTILVKVKDANGGDIGQTTRAITSVGQSVTPIASYYSQQNTTTPSFYTFNSTSSLQNGNITSYDWDFGDGSKGTGSFTTHDFPTKSVSQIFNVKLSVKSDAGCVVSRTNEITVPPSYNISGGIVFTSTSPCAPSSETFTFTGPTLNVPVGATYNWDYGDGNTAIGNPVNKSFSFTNTYDVKLIIKMGGIEIYKTSKSIVTKGQDVTPVASFIVTNTNSTGDAYNFNSTSTVRSGASITQFDWDFGDGTKGTNINVNKTFTRLTTDKTYTVKLTTTANSGCTHSAVNTVNIPKL